MNTSVDSDSTDWQEAFQGLIAPDLLQLGTLIYDLHLQAGKSYLHDSQEALLFSEAVFHSVQLLVRHRRMETIFERIEGQPQALSPAEPSHITLAQVAQEIIDGAFTQFYAYEPSLEEQQARVHFALKLDPTCADAFLIQGAIEEQAGNLDAAQAAYERAMALAAEQLGAAVFTKEARKANLPPFWAATETRGYMRARQGLAMVRWKQGHLKEAVGHFKALLRLNPNDNQGNRELLIDCLQKLGDDRQIQLVGCHSSFEGREEKGYP